MADDFECSDADPGKEFWICDGRRVWKTREIGLSISIRQVNVGDKQVKRQMQACALSQYWDAVLWNIWYLRSKFKTMDLANLMLKEWVYLGNGPFAGGRWYKRLGFAEDTQFFRLLRVQLNWQRGCFGNREPAVGENLCWTGIEKWGNPCYD